MEDGKFVHLHLHTEYSLLDGFTQISRLFEKAKALGMDSVAITDHGVMFGVVDFFKAAKKAGVKPIIGCEVYVAPRSRFDKTPQFDKHAGHLVLLVKNQVGYKNLVKLVSCGFTEGFYYKPRIDYDLLKLHSEGLICLSACIAGDVQKRILERNYQGAVEAANLLKSIFAKGDFYLEMQDHGMPEQKEINQGLIRLSKELEIPLVATNDVHYIDKEDAQTHDVLLCIQTGKVLSDQDRMRFPSNEFYLKSPNEMRTLFRGREEAVLNTVRIAEKCHFEFDFNTTHLPEYDLKETSPKGKLRSLCLEGLTRKYDVTTTHKERLEYELKIIHEMGYDDYFLIVWDFIQYAKKNGIFVGPGRGSCGGSIVAYVLDITEVDPIKYDLIFERFLNPERITLPDIDIDFEDDRRSEVIEYVVEKYGQARVAQIITFGTMAARAAVRDVGRVMDLPYQDVDRMAKEIPMEIGMTLEKALSRNPKLVEIIETSADAKALMKAAIKLEGMPRHASTHAAGVLISKSPVDELVPLYLQDGNVSTQYNMLLLEELGMLKMDFLGLRTLTVLKNTLQLIKETHHNMIDLSQIPDDDPKVYEMLGRGDSLGLFQLESVGFRRFLRDLKPTVFEDIIAGISLYRPGPMESIPKYIKNKKDTSHIQYVTEALKPILEVTYGCLVYQEQVMRIVRELAGYSYGQSDMVRRAMSKKKMDVMEKERAYFIYGKTDENGEVLLEGCLRNGIHKEAAEIIFDDMVDFAKYAFNKSHAAGYAIIAYQTAYLKCHYPVAYLAALMTSVMGNHSKLAVYIQDAKDHDIQIFPPSINHSRGDFTVEEGAIRYGLHAIKNVGKGIVQAIVVEREKEAFKSFFDFCERIDASELNKKALESMIKAGAFDCFGHLRSQLLAIYERTIDGIHSQKRKSAHGQFSMWHLKSVEFSSEDLGHQLPLIPELKSDSLLQFEKDMLGIYLSGHPLDVYKESLETFTTMSLAELFEGVQLTNGLRIQEGAKVKIGGMIIHKTEKMTRGGQTMAFLEIEDLYDQIEVIVFPKTYQTARQIMEKDGVVLVTGRIQMKEDEPPKLVADQVIVLPQVQTKQYKLFVRLIEFDAHVIDKLSKLTVPYKVEEISTKQGSEIVVYIEKSKKKLKLNGRFRLEDQFMRDLVVLFGKDNIKLMPAKS